MAQFLSLVDGNAPLQSYIKGMGIKNKEEFKIHLSRISFYREVVRLGEEIKSLMPNSKERRANLTKIAELRKQIKMTIEDYFNEI